MRNEKKRSHGDGNFRPTTDAFFVSVNTLNRHKK